MIRTFRMKIVAKRQVTIPHSLLDLLRVKEGDYIEVAADVNRGFIKLSGLKLTPTDLITEKLHKKLDQREAAFEKGEYSEIQDLAKMPEGRARPAGGYTK